MNNDDDNEIEIRPADVASIGLFAKMNSFNKPRSSSFSKSFIGRRYQDTRLDSATRILERTKKREDDIKQRLLQKEEWLKKRQEQTEKAKERQRRRQLAMERKIWEERQKLKALEQQRRENLAAVRLQSSGKGFLCRQRVKKIKREKTETQAVIRIQSQARRQFAAGKVHKIRKQAQEKRRNESATVIQSLYRGQAARNRYENLKEARKQAEKLKEMSSLLDSDLDLTPEPANNSKQESPRAPISPHKNPVVTPRMKYIRVGGGYERRPVEEEVPTEPANPKPKNKSRSKKNGRKEVFITATQARSILTSPQWSGADHSILHQAFENKSPSLILDVNVDPDILGIVGLPSPTRKLPGLCSNQKQHAQRPATRHNKNVGKRPKRPNTRPAMTKRPVRQSPQITYAVKKKRPIRRKKAKQKRHEGDFPLDSSPAADEVFEYNAECSADVESAFAEATKLEYEKANVDYSEDGFESDDDGYGSDGFESDN